MADYSLELKLAADSRNWTLVDNLLSASDVTRCDIEQSCLLHKLAAAPEVSLSLARDILTKILKHEVDINMVDKNEYTAIVLAARCDNTKMVMELLSRQAALPPDVTHVCSFLNTLTNNWKPQDTPYIHALVVKLLWDRLKDTALHSCDTQLHHTLVRLAVTFHTSLVREMFVTQQQVNAVDSEGMAVLHRVAMFDSDDHVRLLLFLIIKGADVNLQNTTGDTPLHVAAKHKNWMMMEALLHRRGNSDMLDCEQRSVLHIVGSYTNPVDFTKFDKYLPLLVGNSNDINKQDGGGNTALHLAALGGNMKLGKTLLDHGARADGVNNEQRTVLHMLAMTNTYNIYTTSSLYIPVLLLILKKGVDTHTRDVDGNSALGLAAKHNKWDMVEILLKYVDNAAELDSEGFNILHRSAMGSLKKSVFYQLSQRVNDINQKSRTGDAPIHLAAKCNNWDITRLLLRQGAIIEDLDSEGFHILHRMATAGNGHNYLSRYMAKCTNYNTRCSTGETVLQLAAKHDNWPMVERLATHVENVDEVDSEGLTILQRLVMTHNSSFLLFCHLIDLGADYTCRDGSGDTLMHLAARHGRWEIVQYLIEAGLAPDTPDSEGFVILHRAAAASTQNVMSQYVFQYLLKHNPDLNKRTNSGDTAIHLSAKHKQWETVVTLMEHGANPFDCDSEDASVLDRVVKSSYSLDQKLSILKMAAQRNKTLVLTNSTLVFEAAKSGNWDVVQYLVDQGVNIHQLDSEGLSLLHIIARREQSRNQDQSINKLVKVLLDNGMSMDDRYPNDNTPLKLAAKSNNWELVEYLLLQGATVQSPDSEGVFVLQRLAMYSDYHESQRQLLQLLIKAGADVDVRHPSGDSLLHLSARVNNWSFVSHIVQERSSFDLDELDSDGFNILHRLAQSDRGAKWVEKGLIKGFKLEVTCRNGDTCLLLAAKKEKWDFVKRILKHIHKSSQPCNDDLNRFSLDTSSRQMPSLGFPNVEDGLPMLDKRDVRGYTVWHYAAMKKQWDIIQELTECGVNTDHVDDEGLNILQKMASDCVNSGKYSLMKFLKEKGFDFTIKDDFGDTLLQLAAKSNNLQMVSLLLDHVYDVRAKDSDELPVLRRVCQMIPTSTSSELLNIVTRLIKSGADVEELSWDGNTPLHVAAKCKTSSLVSLLLEHGAQARVCDSEGLYLLHRLATRDQTWTNLETSLINEFLQTGASMNQKDLQGNTPLHLAVQHQNWELAQELVQCGAEVNELDCEGYTVLHRLAQMQYPQIAHRQETKDSEECEDHFSQNYEHDYVKLTRLVLENGGKSDILSRCGETICEIAARNENWDVLKCLLTHGKLALGVHDISLLHCWAASDNGDYYTYVYDLLIEKGLSAETGDHDGNTVLHLAAKVGNWDLVKHLIQKGAKCRTLDNNGFSVLHRFVSDMNRYANSHRLDVVDMIISLNIDVNAEDPRGNTALQTAAKRGLLDVVDRLTDTADNFNTKDSDGFTLLMRLSQTPDSLDFCEHLVQEGADINACSTDGDSALTLAIKSDNWSVVKLLLRKGAHFDVHTLQQLYAIHRLIKCQKCTFPDLQILKLFIIKGVSKDLPDFYGKTPAGLALTHKKWKLFKYLLQCGACLNNSSTKGLSVFHELAKYMYDSSLSTDITRHLISSGLDINLKNSAGDTPVHVAADNDNYDIVKTFVENGADTNKLDRHGNSLLYKIIRKLIWEPIVEVKSGMHFIDRCMSALQQPEFVIFGNIQYNLIINDLERTELVPDSLVKLIKTLKELGADFNWRGPENKTVFQMAVHRERWEVVGVLLETGAEYSLSQQDKQSAIKTLHNLKWKDVSENKLKSFIDYITNDLSEMDSSCQDNCRSDDLQSVVQNCVGCSNWRMATVLVEGRGERCAINTKELLLWMMMSRYSQKEHAEWTCFLDLLISKGLDINSKHQNGSGVLFHDATINTLTCDDKSFDGSLFYALMERGADPLVVNSAGQTLLREVVGFGGQRTLNALKKILPIGVTTHQPRFTEDRLKLERICPEQIASPTEKVIQDQNVCVLKMLIESGASSNAELFRLNTEYQVKLAGQADTDDNVTELLEVLNMAASQPRSLQSLCRLTVSHCLGCGPGRTDKLNGLLLPSVTRDLVLFRDLYEDSPSQNDSNSNEAEDILMPAYQTMVAMSSPAATIVAAKVIIAKGIPSLRYV